MDRKQAYATVDRIKAECKAKGMDKDAVLDLCCTALGITRSQVETEKTGASLWLRQKIYGPAKAQIRTNPNALVYARTYPMWLVKGADTVELHQLVKNYNYVWNAVAHNFQDELGKIRSYYESIARMPEPQAAALRKQADFSRLHRLKREMSDFVWTFDHRLPAEMLRSLEKRLGKVLARAGKEKWDAGYPALRDGEDFGIDLYFNGANLEMADWSDSTSAKNGYMSISERRDPPNHHGRRGGRREQRQLRRLAFVLPRPGGNRKDNPIRLEFDALIHDPHRLPSRIKGTILTCKRGKYEVCFVLNDERPVVGRTKKKLAGVKIGWRIKEDGAIAAVHVYGDYYMPHSVEFAPNRFSNRFCNNPDHAGFPRYKNTPEGKEEFQREMDKRKDQVKAALGEWLKQNGGLPAGWDLMGKRGMLHLPLTDTDIATIFVRWLKWDAHCGVLYAKLCASIAARIRDQYFVIANKICREYTDIGVPDKFVKQVAEAVHNKKKRAKMTDEEKAASNAAARRRQLVGPAGFVQILRWVARKYGCRVHTINPWMIARRCHKCRTDNPPTIEETYYCGGCGKEIRADENAAQWAKDFASECSGGDDSPGGCSHDGKSKPLVGFPDAPAKKAERAEAQNDGHSERNAQDVAAA